MKKGNTMLFIGLAVIAFFLFKNKLMPGKQEPEEVEEAEKEKATEKKFTIPVKTTAPKTTTTATASRSVTVTPTRQTIIQKSASLPSKITTTIEK